MTVKTKKLSSKEIDALERQVPELARIATKAAHARALSISESVLCIDSGELVWKSLDSSKTVVAKAKPRRKVKLGEVVTVRRIEEHAVPLEVRKH
jgi:seryl-tRNA(Sec) selenium transferase